MIRSRFEVRSCRTGHLKAVHETLEEAKGSTKGPVLGGTFVTDLDRPIPERIVWSGGEVSIDARRWLAMLGQLLRSCGHHPNVWESL